MVSYFERILKIVDDRFGIDAVQVGFNRRPEFQRSSEAAGRGKLRISELIVTDHE